MSKIEGQGTGAGYIQKFIRKKGGKKFLLGLKEKAPNGSVPQMAQILMEEYKIYLCSNTLINIMKEYGISRNKVGGDRRSKKYKKELT